MSTKSKPDFANFAKLKLKPDVTAVFTFFELEGNPSLEVKPAGETNKAFMNAVLKKNSSVDAVVNKKKHPTVEDIEISRIEDCSLFSEYVVVSFVKEPVDTTNKPVKFSKENCRLFLEALPLSILRRLTQFCLNDSNFREEDELNAEEVSEMAKN